MRYLLSVCCAAGELVHCLCGLCVFFRRESFSGRLRTSRDLIILTNCHVEPPLFSIQLLTNELFLYSQNTVCSALKFSRMTRIAQPLDFVKLLTKMKTG